MEFLNKLGKKASEAYKGAAEKTGKLTKEAKLKIKMADNKTKIKNIYEEIGQKIYQKHISEEEICVKDLIKDECLKIDELAKEIEEAEKEILELSNFKQCEDCKEKIEKEAKFCSKCGKGQPEIKKEEKEENNDVLEEKVISEESNEKTEEKK